MDRLFVFWSILLLFSALFSVMEMALISSGKIEYLMSKRKKGILYFMLDRVYSDYTGFLTSLTLGNLFVSILFFYTSFQLFSPYLISNYAISLIGLYAVVIFLSLMILVISSELLPRLVTIRRPGAWVKILLLPSFVLYVLFLPFVKVFSFAGRVVLSLFGVNVKLAIDDPLFQLELDELIRKSIDDISDSIESDSEVKILKNALEFSNVRIRDCMVPRTDIVAISEDAELGKLKDLFIESGISRVLVYREDIDNIVGYIHVWEMFNKTNKWTNNIAELSFVPESMPANILMNELMQEHKSIAVVVDEFGGTSGVITIEDLVEEIFGEIEDEYDSQEKFIKKEQEGVYIMSGRVEIDTLNEELGIDIPEAEEYSTVAGYLLNHMQRFPKTYETIQLDRFVFKVLKVTARKIEVVKMEIGGKA